MSQRPDYDAQYQPQSTDERLWDDGVTKQPVPRDRPNYKPTPLRWYFVVVLILSIMGLMALVVWAKLAMPDSDSSYTDLSNHNRSKRVWVRADGLDEVNLTGDVPTETIAVTTADIPTGKPVITTAQDIPTEKPVVTTQQNKPFTTTLQVTETMPDDHSTETAANAADLDAYRGTTTFTTHQRITSTVKGFTGTFTSFVPTTLFTTKVISPTAVVHTAELSTSWVQVTITHGIVASEPPADQTTAAPPEETAPPYETTVVIRTSWFSGWVTDVYTGSVMSSSPWSSAYEVTETITLPGVTKSVGGGQTSVAASSASVAASSAAQSYSYEVSSSAVIITAPGKTESVGGVTTVTSAIGTSTVASVGTTTQAPTTFITLGKVTVTSVYTNPDYHPPKDKPSQKPSVKVVDVVTVESDKVINQVQSLAPVTRVSKVHDSVETVVVSRPPGEKETVVEKVGGHTTLVDVTSIGKDGVPTTNKVVSTVGGGYTTYVKPQEKQQHVETVTSEIGVYTTAVAVTTYGEDGKPTVKQVQTTVGGGQTTLVDVVTTGEDGLPTTKQVVSTIGGSYTTLVDVVTTGADGLPTTKQVVSTIGGSYTTLVDVVTTGADGLPTTKQVVSTVDGSYTTLVDITTTGTDGLPTVTQVVSTVDGRYTTFLRTVDNDAITSSISGYTTLVESTFTGTDGKLTTTRVKSTVSGKLTTFTFKPTTYTKTRSGYTTTITSSRTGSTTIHSTKKGQTKTHESTTLITPTQTDQAQATDEGVTTVEHVYNINDGTYFVGKFLPPFLSVMLSIPARIIDLNAQLYQPFYALNRPNGGLGPSTMTLHFGGWTGFLKPFAILAEGQPVTFFSMLLVWCSAVMTPVATEAIGVKIHGYCTPLDPKGCAAALGVSPTSTRALLALLALAVVLLCLLLLFLRNWDTGLYANPWSVAGVASLATNREVRPKRHTERKMAAEMRDKRFGFGYFENAHGQTEYGIVLYDDAGQDLRTPEGVQGTLSEVSSLDSRDERRRKRRGNPFIALGVAWRLGFVAFLVGLMALILYFGTTFRSQNRFQSFMASQTFGIRFLFAAIGVVISFGWGALFISVAMITPYQVMSYTPQTAPDSILLTRPTNPFSGVWSALKHGQPFPAVVAIMAIFSEFMPILLANIPYTITQTEVTHRVCLWLSTAILGLMVLTITVSFYIVWPHMPVDPRSIAGAMYYVSESGMLGCFEGMASLDNRQRERRVEELGGGYWYGEVVTQSGVSRPAVERDDGTLGDAARQPALHINANPHDIDTAYHGYEPEHEPPSNTTTPSRLHTDTTAPSRPHTVSPMQAGQGDTLSTQYSGVRGPGETTGSDEMGSYEHAGFHDYQDEVTAAAAGLQQQQQQQQHQQPEPLYDPHQRHRQPEPLYDPHQGRQPRSPPPPGMI